MSWPPTMRLGSLCSGYGGLDLAANDVLGSETAWHCEIDPDAATVLRANFPGAPNHGDIAAVDWRAVEPVDVLAAGFPCQPVSYAGYQRGTEDARWLWPHVQRAIRELWPRWVVLENVEALAARRQAAALAGILEDLASAGFRARWCLLGACAVGACHHRHRWFLLAERASEGGAGQVALMKCGAPRNGELRTLPTPDANTANRGPRSAEALARGNRQINLNDLSRLLVAGEATGERFAQYAAAVERWEAVSGRPVPEPTEPSRTGTRRLAAPFAEWMMGLEPGWVTDHVPRIPALRAIGNGVVPLQAAEALRAMLLSSNAQQTS